MLTKWNIGTAIVIVLALANLAALNAGVYY